jgi:hypothetical protein
LLFLLVAVLAGGWMSLVALVAAGWLFYSVWRAATAPQLVICDALGREVYRCERKS